MNARTTLAIDCGLKSCRLRRMISLGLLTAWLVPASLWAAGANPAAPIELGRLFFTPAQRAQLEASRPRPSTASNRTQHVDVDSPPVPLRFDGVVIRSDGRSMRWVNGAAEMGSSSVSGLKPGQIRADGKVYEPYQVLQPNEAAPREAESAP